MNSKEKGHPIINVKWVPNNSGKNQKHLLSESIPGQPGLGFRASWGGI